MCGIVGYVNPNVIPAYRSDVKKLMAQLLIADSFRGMHSTGLAAISDKGYSLTKKPVPGWDFVDMKKTESILSSPEKYDLMIGHNRYATMGAHTGQNAHPFHHGSVIGVHNGSIRNHRSLEDGNKFAVDSEAIIYNLYKNDTKDVIKQLSGAFTLVWYDFRDHRLRIVRNDERPFYFLYTKGTSPTMVYGSELEMLKWVVNRGDLEVDNDRVYQLKPGQLMTIDPKNHEEYSLERVELAPPPAVVGYGAYSGYGGNTAHTSRAGTYPGTTKREECKEKEGNEVFFEVTGYVSYNSSSTHSIRGVSLGKPEYPIRVFNQAEDKAKEMTHNQEMCTGTINSIYWDGHERNYVLVISPETISPLFYSQDEDGIVLKENDMVVGPTGDAITVKEFDNLTRHGCAVCTGNVHAHDSMSTDWTADGQPICKHCVEQWQDNTQGVA